MEIEPLEAIKLLRTGASKPLFLYLYIMVERDDKGRVLKGSKLNQKYTKAEVIEIFEGLADLCIAGEYLSIQECQMHSGMRPRTFYEYAEKYPELEDIKQQMNDAIIANINKGALKGNFNPASAIWRMKNLGERDRQELDVAVKEQPLFDLSKIRKK